MINYEFEGVTYKIVITRKKIKNTYIRVGDNNTILVTTNEIMPENEIIDLVTKNMNKIIKMFNKKTKSVKDNYFLGKKYNVIYGTSDFNIIGDYIYAKDKKTLDKWYDNQIQDIYNKRLKEIYNLFEEKIPFPKLKVRKMKTRWGVCNRYTKTITLNYNLIYYNISCLDYVITHELSHFVHFNHSKKFWDLVEKYFKDYKEAKKALKE